MASILGLINSENVDRFKNYRRSVFYYYPQGAAPLTGLLTLMKEEATNDPQFYWFEKRKVEQRGATAAITGNIPFYSTGVTVAGGIVTAGTLAAANITTVLGTQYAIKMAAGLENLFRIGHIVRIMVTNSAAASVEFLARVNAVNDSTQGLANVLGITALNVLTINYNVAANVGADVNVVGNAFAEGSVGSSDNVYSSPLAPYGYTQIFRTSYEITGTALKTSAKFDDRGTFPDQAKEAMLNHATEMEKGFIWGERTLLSVTSGGATTITRTAGGIMYYMRLWEAGATYGNTAATLDTDDTKRIILNATGRLAWRTFLGYMERAFRMTNTKTTEKLGFCGSGAINILTQMFSSKVVQMQKPPAGDTYGLELIKVILPFGTLYLKTHPLFTENPVWRNSMLIIEMSSLKYRYLSGRDTELLKDRQPRNADYLQHEYLTECGLEVNFPESFMYIQNILDWEP